MAKTNRKIINKIYKNEVDNKYQNLLREQIFWMNRNFKELSFKARNLYIYYIKDSLKYNIKDRCCNFKLLEEKCLEYNLQTVE